MTYKDKFDQETDWKKKVLLVEFVHLLQLSRHTHWTLHDTAKAFEKSMGLISENLKLAEALREGLDANSRAQALKFLKSGIFVLEDE